MDVTTLLKSVAVVHNNMSSQQKGKQRGQEEGGEAKGAPFLSYCARVIYRNHAP